MPSIHEPPFEQVEGISNFRSIGGYPLITSSPKCSTRHNFVYRSADPCYITSNGRSKVKSLGITTVFDLRSQPEIDKQLAKEPSATDPIAEGVTRRFTPVFANEDWSPEAIAQWRAIYTDSSGAEGFVLAYSEILERGHAAFREILLHVRDRPSEPLLCHCSAGKDRTGVTVALLLKIAGCSDEVVAQEYHLTKIGLAAWKDLMKLSESQETAEKAASAK